jgi:hypothetical protein
MTHTTWHTSTAFDYTNPKMKKKNIFKEICKDEVISTIFSKSVLGSMDPYLGTWTRTWEPGPVLGNLDLNRTLVEDPYLGTWTRTWETGPVLGNFEFDPYSFMYSGSLVRETKTHTPYFWFFYNKEF